MMHSDNNWNDVLEVATTEKILKARTLNDAFWRYLKDVYRRLKCRENVDNKAEMVILTIFEKMFWNCLEHFESNEDS